MTMKLAVLGHPVAHSRSPDIHHLFARQLGLEVTYRAIDIPVGHFAEQIEALVEAGYVGFNVTVPHKETAFTWVSKHSHRALQAGAVNTLVKNTEAGLWWGDTTDGEGLVRDLTDIQGVRLSGRRLLILGAGGAVRGIMAPLLAAGPAGIHIANRTRSRAEGLVDLFAEEAKRAGCQLSAGGFDSVDGRYDLIINGTSASLSAEVPPLGPELITTDTIAYDMVYGAVETPFNAWARQAGAGRTLDGLGMLVGQAAASFEHWTGQRPDIAPVLSTLRRQLQR